MDVLLASDIEALGHMLGEVSERDRLHRDFTLDSLSTVVRELIACFSGLPHLHHTTIRGFRGRSPGHSSGYASG